MTTKEQEFIKKSFKDGFFRVFDKNEDAKAMHELLAREGVKHDFGDYLHEVEGTQRYNNGIRVLETRKLQDLILSPADEDNPIKDMESIIAPGANTVEVSETPKAVQAEGDRETEQNKAADPAPKKASRKPKKVNL